MIKKILFVTLYALICISLVALAVKGQKENPLHFQTVKDTSVGGPFESSNNTSRYALTEAIAEDKTFFFNNPRARFATPDVEEYNGKIFSDKGFKLYWSCTPHLCWIPFPDTFRGKKRSFFLKSSLVNETLVLLPLDDNMTKKLQKNTDIVFMEDYVRRYKKGLIYPYWHGATKPVLPVIKAYARYYFNSIFR